MQKVGIDTEAGGKVAFPPLYHCGGTANRLGLITHGLDGGAATESDKWTAGCALSLSQNIVAL